MIHSAFCRSALIVAAAMAALPGAAHAGPVTFGDPEELSWGWATRTLKLGDMTGDGSLDVVQGAQHMIRAYLNTGGGHFERGETSMLSEVVHIEVLDMNNNGVQDVVAVTSSAEHGGHIRTLRGLGDGTFSLTDTKIPVDPGRLAIGDFNGSGSIDLALVDWSDGLQILLNDGAGNFELGQRIEFSGTMHRIASADLTGNGVLDLVISNSPNNRIFLLAGLGDGRFDVVQTVEVRTNPEAVTTADLNGNGYPDVVVSFSSAEANMMVLRNIGGHLVEDGLYGVPTFVEDILLGDFNGNGHIDIAVANDSTFTPRLHLLFNDGEGGFGTSQDIPVESRISAVAIGDLTGNGLSDVVTSKRLGRVFVRHNLTVPPPPCIADWTGDGEVDINDFFAYLADFEAGDPRADLNNDGEIDVNDFLIFLQEFEAGC